MAILLISPYYAPEITGIGLYTHDLAKELSKTNLVTVLTGFPHYPSGAKYPINDFARVSVDDETNIKVIRVRLQFPLGNNAISRILYELMFLVKGYLSKRELRGDTFDCIVAYLPTLSAGLLARNLAGDRHIPYIAVCQDISSKATVESGIFLGKFFSFFSRQFERLAFSSAKTIVVISENMKSALETLLIEHVPIEVIHNYPLIEKSKLDKSKARDLLNWDKDQFIALHTGNMGFKQHLENLISTSKLLDPNENIRILVMGHGNRENTLKKRIQDNHCLVVLPASDSEHYPICLAAADVLLINERSSLNSMSLPSKLTSYFVSGKPILAAVSPTGATRQFLEGKALIVNADNPNDLSRALRVLKESPELQEKLSESSIEFVGNNLNPDLARARYLHIINSVIKRSAS